MSDEDDVKDKKKVKATVVVVVADPKPVKLFSFDQYMSRKGIKAHHKGGMKAFVKNSNWARSMEEWDACFVNY